MGVDKPAGEAFEELRAAELEEAGSHDKIGLVSGHRIRQRTVPGLSVRMVAHALDEGVDACLAGQVLATGAVPVGAHCHDRGAVVGQRAGIEERGEVGPASGDEDDDTSDVHEARVVREGGRLLLWHVGHRLTPPGSAPAAR